MNPKILRAYYKAHQKKLEDRNAELWLLGAYTYQAILSASPIFNPFAKKGTKPIPYLDKPFESQKTSDTPKIPKSVREDNERLKAYLFFKTWADTNNKINSKK